MQEGRWGYFVSIKLRQSVDMTGVGNCRVSFVGSDGRYCFRDRGARIRESCVGRSSCRCVLIAGVGGCSPWSWDVVGETTVCCPLGLE
jgi:hypothetical protein